MSGENIYEQYSENILQEEGYNLIGAAFEVYNELGSGLLEEIYQLLLEIELNLRAIPFDSKKQLQVYYKSVKLNKVYIPDLVLYNEIIVEIKSVSALNEDHEAQLLNYMKITKSRIGYLLNFGCKDKLEWKRYILTTTDKH